MDTNDVGFWEYCFKCAVGGLFLIGAWLWRELVGDVKDMGEDIMKTKDALSDHRLIVSENYAKKTDLAPIYSKLDDVQNDIKILIGRKQQKDDK